jgi:hypothetical protein
VWSEPPLREELSGNARMQLLPICSRAILKRQRATPLPLDLKPMPLASLPDLVIPDFQKLPLRHHFVGPPMLSLWPRSCPLGVGTATSWLTSDLIAVVRNKEHSALSDSEAPSSPVGVTL